MIRLHWMQNHTNLSIHELKKLSAELDDAGYYSFLLPFSNNGPDLWIKSAHALNKYQKIKYMIALRPYHLSPQYFSMMVAGFDDIQPNRLLINMVAGDGRKDEPDQMDIFGDTKNLLTVDQRKEQVRKFLLLCNEVDILQSCIPEFVISGLSDYTVETAKMFNQTILCMYDDYFNNIERLADCNRRMVSLRIYIRETQEEADKMLSLTNDTRHQKYTLYGTEESVTNKIKLAIESGVTDFLIGGHEFDDQKYRIHDFVKKLRHMI